MKRKKISIFIGSIIITVLLILTAILYINTSKNVETHIQNAIDPEILKSMDYQQLTDEESKIDNCDYVKFGAFFTRDLNGDNKAEKLLGTCRNINEKDVLYMDINVISNGYLDNAKIIVNGTNFNYSMSMVKDTVLKENYISDDVKVIELNRIQAGTEKLILGNILADTENNINNYSKDDNTITLTGIHVDDNGNITEINKTINLKIDWHGTTNTSLYTKYSATTFYYNYDNLESDTISFDFRFDELQEELLLEKNVVTATIPSLNGIAPTNVECTNSNVESTYDKQTHTLTLTRSSKSNEQGLITQTLAYSNKYNVNITYPKEAYEQISSYTTLDIPISGYYTGYNNKEFTSPYTSNIEKGNITIVFKETPKGDVYNFYVDFIDKKYVKNKENTLNNYHYVVSKQDLINLYDSNEEIKNKEYVVRWQAVRGLEGKVDSMVMSETKTNYGDKWNDKIMNEYVSNIGIYFTDADKLLEENGTISVYNNDTNALLKTFTKDEWNKYSREEPFKYDEPVTHIRVETSSAKTNAIINVYNVKQLDVSKVLEDFTKQDIQDIGIIYTYLTGVCNIDGENTNEINKIDYAYYISEKSDIKLELRKEKMSTQETCYNQIISITADYNQEGDAKWKDGEFLIEIPEEVINMKINNVSVNNNKIHIIGSDLYQENGKYFIKIITQNDEPDEYTITIDCNMTADPRGPTINKYVKLYAYNKYCNDYYTTTTDSYDVDDDNNKTEETGADKEYINFLSPTSLITLETVSNYDEDNEITIAPNVAGVERDTRTAKINVNLTNNYPNTVTGVKILGKIPFENNTYILNEKSMNSKFTTTMDKSGIEVPEQLKGKVEIYYSTNENPTIDLTDSANGWKTDNDVDDFSEIKTYLIDLKENVIQVGYDYQFSYIINIPERIDYNLVSYSNHAVYYEISTEGGNFSLTTEPNKVGVRIVKKFDLELVKYKINSNVAVPGVTYALKYNEEDENGEDSEITRVLTTNSEGKIYLKNLYVEREYKLQEVKVPDTCELNSEEITFSISADGIITLNGIEMANSDESLNEIIKSSETIRNYNFSTDQVLHFDLEDEVKYNLQINKTKSGSSLKIDGVRFTLKDSNGNSKSIRTEKGMAIFEGLSLNNEYILNETAVPGTCELNNGELKFKLVRENGVIKLETISNTLTTQDLTLNNDENILTPVVVANVSNEIKYSLHIEKQDTNGNKLSSIQFNIKGKGFNQNGNTFRTSEEGTIDISGLSIGETYTIKETLAVGYYLDKEKENSIQFSVNRQDGELKITTWDVKEGITLVEEKTILEKDLTAVLSVILQNEKVPTYNLNILKVNEDNEKLIGAQFRLTSADTEQEQIITIGEDGKGTFENLYEYIEGKCVTGEYILEEIYAPQGYSLNNTKLRFKAIRNNEGIVQIEILEGEDIIKVKDDNSNISDSIDNSENEKSIEEEETLEKEIVSDKDSVTLSIVNKPIFILNKLGDNDIPLANVKFVITDLDGNPAKDVNGNIVGEEENINGTIYNVVTTNEKGEISVDLPKGKYKAVEIQTLEGYSLSKWENKRSYYFGIDESKPEEEKFGLAWKNTTSSYLYSKINSTVATDDGGVIAVGTSYGDTSFNEEGASNITGEGLKDGIIIKYRQDGTIEWQKSFGGEYDDELLSIAKCPSGGYIVAGYTMGENKVNGSIYSSEEYGNEDGIFIKIDDSRKLCVEPCYRWR